MSLLAFSNQPSELSNLPLFLAQTPATASSDSYFIVWHIHAAFWLSVAVLVLILVLWILVSLRRRSRTLEVFTNTSGRVQVSRGALGDLVESSALQFGVVSRPRVNFKIRSGQV